MNVTREGVFRRFPSEDPQHGLPASCLWVRLLRGHHSSIIETNREVVGIVRFAYNRSVGLGRCLPGMSYDAPTLNAGEINLGMNLRALIIRNFELRPWKI